ncbi:MAG: HD domain-containing protein [Pirellulales bacterium]|nr:HD domain-containing protein [Pirellulales bacterium]
MSHERIRRQVAYEAARLMLRRHESELTRAKTRAAQSITRGWQHPDDLPTDREIRDELELMAERQHADGADDDRRLLSLDALRLMRRLKAFRPVLVGRLLSALEIDFSMTGVVVGWIHVFAESAREVLAMLADDGVRFRAVDEPERDAMRLSLDAPAGFEVLVHGDETSVFASGDGLTLHGWADLVEFEHLLVERYADITLGAELLEPVPEDRFEVYRMLLAPLEHVKQSPKRHPEGDALCHSLQVFDLARGHLPYDEEFLLAALLHDVGKGIDRHDHIRAALAALGDAITPRTAWLIEHHADATALREGKLGARSRRRLEADESFEELMLLARCDREGRRRKVEVPELDEAIDYLRELAEICGE